jgi:D-arginine utilization repressor
MSRSLAKLQANYTQLFPICEGIAAWLSPHVEVVLHDLETDRVVKIWNNISRRKPGDQSLIAGDIQIEDDRDVYGPYERSNWDGRRLKCVSSVVRCEKGFRSGLLCLNLDVSQFDALGTFLNAFATSASNMPASLNERDWREQIHTALGEFQRQINTALPALTRAQKIQAVRELDAQHLFATRNAVQHVGEILGVSRATVYNWLSEARNGRN